MTSAINAHGKGMGFVHVADGRDRNYMMAPLLKRLPIERLVLPKEKLYPQDKWWGDQDTTPMCTAFGWLHWWSEISKQPTTPPMQPRDFYCAEQTADPWPGDCTTPPFYDGTSVRAGSDVLKQRGIVMQYRWINDVETLRATIAFVSPVVIGIDWYESMDNPDKNGVLDVRGAVVGGHCVLINGFIKVANGNHWYRIKNSWGRSWGDKGNAWIRERKLKPLVVDRASEFVAPITVSSFAAPSIDEAPAR